MLLGASSSAKSSVSTGFRVTVTVREKLLAGGVAVFVPTDQVGVAFGRGELFFGLHLVLFVLVGLVLDFDEGETPSAPPSS